MQYNGVVAVDQLRYRNGAWLRPPLLLCWFAPWMWEGQGIRTSWCGPRPWERVSNFDLLRNIWHALRLLGVR